VVSVKSSPAVAIAGLKGAGAHAAAEMLYYPSVGQLTSALYGFIMEDLKKLI